MKNVIASTFLFVLFTVSLTAQSNWRIGSLKITKFDFSVGHETEKVDNYDYNYFADHIVNSAAHCSVGSEAIMLQEAQRANLNQLNFATSELESSSVQNLSINIGITLQPERLSFLEWRNALSVKPRVEAMTYHNNSSYEGNYMNIRSTNTELAIESAMLIRLPVLSFLNIYGGVGTNLGITHFDETCIYTSQNVANDEISLRNNTELSNELPEDGFGLANGYSECFTPEPQLAQRVFAQLGTGIVISRFELGFDVKYGAGYRMVPMSSNHKTNLVSTNFNLRYILN